MKPAEERDMKLADTKPDAEGYDVGRQAGYEGSHAEGYEAGYNKGYDEGLPNRFSCKSWDLRFQALSREITTRHSWHDGEFGERIDPVKDAEHRLRRRE